MLGMCAIYSTVVVLIAMRQGPGMSVDSVYYFQAAASFAASGEFAAFGIPFTLWPPGYPWLLSRVLIAGGSPELTVIVVNSLCMVATVVLTYLIARVSTDSRAVALVSAAVVAALPATVRTYSMMWTEPPFTVLSLSTLLLSVAMAKKAWFRPWHVLLLGVMITIATLLRIAGVALIPVAALAAFLATRSKPLVARMTHAALVGILSSAGLAAVVYRNVALGVPALGERSPNGLPVQNLIGHSLQAFGRYVIPDSGGLMPIEALGVQGPVALVVTGATILVGVPVFLMLVLATFRAVRRRDFPLVLLALWVYVWWAMLWYSVLAAGVPAPDDRLLAPALPATTVLLADWVIATSRPALFDRWRHAPIVLGAAVLSWGVVSVTTGIIVAASASQAGIGYNRVAIQGSPLVASIRSLPTGAPIAATDPWLAYWTSRHPTYSVYDGRIVPLAKGGRVQFMAFFRDSTGTVTPKSIIDDGVRLELVEQFADGSLYRVARD